MIKAYQDSASQFLNTASALGISDLAEGQRLAGAVKNGTMEDFEQLTGIGNKL